MANFTNQTKNSATILNSRKGGIATWDDSIATWDDSSLTWNNNIPDFTNQTKSTVLSYLNTYTGDPTSIVSYNEINRSNNLDTTTHSKIGESFTITENIKLTSLKIYCHKTGLPTGNAVVKIYNITGISGINAYPIGTELSTSDNFDVSTMGLPYFLYEFIFSGDNQVILSPGNYCFQFEYSGSDSSNYINIGTDGSIPTYNGNLSWYSTSWSTLTNNSLCFYIYGILEDTSELPPSFINQTKN